MIGTSIIPDRERLVNEYNHHVYEYRWLDFREHNGSRLSRRESIEFSWRWKEAHKLAKVLDVLYPSWKGEYNDRHSNSNNLLRTPSSSSL